MNDHERALRHLIKPHGDLTQTYKNAVAWALTELESLRAEVAAQQKSVDLFHEVAAKEIARLQALNVGLADRVAARLRKIADSYEKDGQPGPFGFNCWGWRSIAAHLRDVANEVDAKAVTG